MCWPIAAFIIGFAIDGQALSQGSYSQECAVGAQVSLTVTLINSSGVHMPASFLYFEPSFLSQQQKRFLKDISHLLLHSGGLVVSVPEVGTLCVCACVCVLHICMYMYLAKNRVWGSYNQVTAFSLYK